MHTKKKTKTGKMFGVLLASYIFLVIVAIVVAVKINVGTITRLTAFYCRNAGFLGESFCHCAEMEEKCDVHIT